MGCVILGGTTHARIVKIRRISTRAHPADLNVYRSCVLEAKVRSPRFGCISCRDAVKIAAGATANIDESTLVAS